MKNNELEEIKATIYQKNLTYDELVNEAAFWQDWATTMETAYEKANEIATTYESMHDRIKTLVLTMEEAHHKGLNRLQDESLLQIKEALIAVTKQEKDKRRTNAIKAADTRHSQPGGSRDKQQKIREIWATGKYSSRDICAEEECTSLGMSFSAARKALRNTPPTQ